MFRYIRRLSFAFIISAACYAGTVYWYESGQVNLSSNIDAEPIAQLKSHTNEIQRKPVTRVIWESISENEPLYAGETIRTASDAQATILFLGANTLIELEPESMIAIEEGQDGIALNFLAGNLFVKSGKGEAQAEAPKLKLKSGKSEIALKGAELSLTQDENSGKVDLQVFKGVAEVKQGEKTVKVEENKGGELSESAIQKKEGFIKIISPTAGLPIYVNPEKAEPVAFTWEPLQSGYTVHLEWGSSSSKLQQRQQNLVKGESGSLVERVKVGRVYWRLVATSQDPNLPTLKSQTFRTQIIAKTPPVLLEPADEKRIVINPEKPDVSFSWITRMELNDMSLQLSNDANFKDIVHSEKLQPEQTLATISVRQSANYFWRVTGQLEYLDEKGQTKREFIASVPRKFFLQDEVNLVPPALKSPVKGQSIPYTQITEKGLFLSWEDIPGITNYKVHLLTFKNGEWSQQPKIYEVAYSPLRIEKVKPGSYSWLVYSENEEGKISKPSESRQFTVNSIPTLQFADGSDPVERYYFTTKPELSAEWLGEGHNVSYWKYRYFPSDNANAVKTVKTNKTNFSLLLEQDGEYIVQVAGYDTKGRVIAKSLKKSIRLKPLPLLPGPQFAETMPEVLKSTKSGSLDLQWNPVSGANQYQVKLISPSGNVARTTTTDRTVASLQRLRPGNYKVTIQSIDEHKRVGPISEQREVIVPKESAIKAPKIKKIKVN